MADTWKEICSLFALNDFILPLISRIKFICWISRREDTKGAANVKVFKSNSSKLTWCCFTPVSCYIFDKICRLWFVSNAWNIQCDCWLLFERMCYSIGCCYPFRILSSHNSNINAIFIMIIWSCTLSTTVQQVNVF